jgi:anti-sigma regulatory factor (Ser/Thr protein kinase)
LAVVEACNNAVKYATGAGRRQHVLVTMTCDPDLIEFQIIDHTPGFQWPRRAELPPAGSESGRGIYLIQTVMDSAEYQRGRRENTLVLRRLRATRRTPSPSAQPA